MSKTVITEKQLYENRNYDDVFNRALIAGMLKMLNRKLVYTQIWNEEENKVEEVTVPFFYNFGGSNPNSEKFIQDNYTFFSDAECTEIGLKKIDGNFDIYPRGVIELTTSVIDSGNIVNRFSMANYQRKINGGMESFVSFLYSIPLTYTFKVSIKSETLETEFKIEQAIREFFYKNKTFFIYYKGMRIGCRAGFPDSYNGDKAGSTYTMGSDHERYITCSWDIAVETYQPVFDPTSEISAAKYIKSMSSNYDGIDKGSTNNPSIDFINKIDGKTMSGGIDLLLQWTWTSPHNDIEKVTLTWTEIDLKNPDNNKEHTIGTIDNKGFYDWELPVNENGVNDIDVIIYNTESCSVYKSPEIKIIPDADTKTVSADNITIIDKGYFMTEKERDQITGVFSYVLESGKLAEHEFTLNIYNHMIDMSNPVQFKPFLYENGFEPKIININIKDFSSGVESTISNIKIL